MRDLFQRAEAAQSIEWSDGDGHFWFVVVICNTVHQIYKRDLDHRQYLDNSSGPFHEVVPPTFYSDVPEYSMLFGWKEF